jgi:hypothetical protein
MKFVKLRTLFFAGAFPASLLIGCVKKPAIHSETEKQYGMKARSFCEEIVECTREEMRSRLADDVQRRMYLEGRMTDRACMETQLRRIEERPDSAKEMERCTNVLSSTPSCRERLLLLRQDASCRSALNL